MRSFLSLAVFAAGFLATSLAALPLRAQSGPTGTNVAVVDISKIFENHHRFKAAMDGIKKDIESYEGAMRQQQQRIATEAEKLKGFKPGNPDYEKQEESLVQMRSKLQLDMHRQRQDFLEREAQLFYNAYNEVLDHVTVIAQNYNISLVLRYSSEEIDPQDRASVIKGVNRAVVYQQKLDITQLVMDRLNRGTPPAGTAGNNRPQIPRRK